MIFSIISPVRIHVLSALLQDDKTTHDDQVTVLTSNGTQPFVSALSFADFAPWFVFGQTRASTDGCVTRHLFPLPTDRQVLAGQREP